MKQAGDTFSAEKTTYPISLTNSQCKNISSIFWSADSSCRVVSYDFDAHGEHLMLLDEAGTLHLLDVDAEL